MSENDGVVVCNLRDYIVAMIRMHDEVDRDGFVYAIHDLFRIHDPISKLLGKKLLSPSELDTVDPTTRPSTSTTLLL